MKLHQLIAIGAISAFGTGAAIAQGTPPGDPMTGAGGPSFSELDKDGDGLISKKEAKAHPELSKRFSELDANGDGKLDMGEFAQFEVTPADPGLGDPPR
jgi:hypothetical protein